jgi:hypothetical protein
MSRSARIRDAARALRGDLPALELRHGDALDGALSELLAAEEAGADVADELLETMRADPRTRTYVDFFFRFGSPPAPEDVEVRGVSPLPGDPGPVPLAKYSCPMGDYDWYRRAVGQPVPSCPTHRVPLERVELSAPRG